MSKSMNKDQEPQQNADEKLENNIEETASELEEAGERLKKPSLTLLMKRNLKKAKLTVKRITLMKSLNLKNQRNLRQKRTKVKKNLHPLSRFQLL